MKRLLITLTRATWTLLLGGALIAGTTACSKGTEDGAVNVEEAEFKDKSPVEHNPPGLSDETGDEYDRPAPGAMTTDSAYEDVYERQVEKTEDRKHPTNDVQGFGATSEPDRREE